MQTSTARAAGNRTSLASTRPDKASEPLHDPPLGIIWRPKGLQWNRLAAGTKIVEGHGDQMSAAANRNQQASISRPTRAVAENILVKEGKGKKGGGWAHSGAPTQRKSRPDEVGELGARPTQKTRDGADPGAKVEFTLFSKNQAYQPGNVGPGSPKRNLAPRRVGPGPALRHRGSCSRSWDPYTRRPEPEKHSQDRAQKPGKNAGPTQHEKGQRGILSGTAQQTKAKARRPALSLLCGCCLLCGPRRSALLLL